MPTQHMAYTSLKVYISFRITFQKYSVIYLGIIFVYEEDSLCIDTCDGHQGMEKYQF
jgi:hypothetical protein